MTADARPRRTLIVALMGFFLISLDMMIVNVALTAIRVELGGGLHGQQWVVDGYTLTFAALLLLGGNFSERWGAKRTYGTGVVLFTLTSLLCAASPTLSLLVAARFAQGAAAAMMLPASMALIREAYLEPGPRARAVSIWAMGGALAATIGPLVGGILTTVDWRLVFWINVPVGAAIIALLVPLAHSGRHRAPFDWGGQVTAAAGLGALTFGLIEGGSTGWTRPLVIGSFSVAALALTAFALIQNRIRHPMIPSGLLRSMPYRVTLCTGFAFVVGWFGTVFLASLFLQQHLGLEPFDAGLVFLPSAFISVGANVLAGRITSRIGPRMPMALGQLAMVVGLVAMAASAPLGSPLLIAAFIAPVGVGGAFAMPATTALVLDSVPQNRTGSASAIFNSVRQIAGAIAIAVFGALVANEATFVTGMQISLVVAAVGLTISAVGGWVATR